MKKIIIVLGSLFTVGIVFAENNIINTLNTTAYVTITRRVDCSGQVSHTTTVPALAIAPNSSQQIYIGNNQTTCMPYVTSLAVTAFSIPGANVQNDQGIPEKDYTISATRTARGSEQLVIQ